MLRKLLPILCLALLVAAAAPASAHTTKTQGDYSVKVAWADEPPASGARNHVTIAVWKTATGEGVADLADKLQVTIGHGGQTKALALEESDEAPGNYSAALLPTEPGLYTLHVGGKLDDATEANLDVVMEEVANGAADAFPAKNDSTSQLASQVQDLQTRVATLEAKAKAQSTTPASTSGQAPSKGTPGAELGLVVVGVGLLALALRRRG